MIYEQDDLDAPPSDTERFTDGDCWLLMLELNKLTGWPCCAFTWHSALNGELEADTHGFVLTPDGKYLDVEGEWTAQKLRDQYAGGGDLPAIAEFPRSEFRWIELVWEDSRERAKIVARDLLDRYYPGVLG